MLHTFGFSGDGRLGISKNAKGGRTRRLSVEARHTQLRGGAKPVTKTPVGRKVAEDEVAAPTPVFVLTRDGLDHGNVTIASVACGSIHSGCITGMAAWAVWGGRGSRLVALLLCLQRRDSCTCGAVERTDALEMRVVRTKPFLAACRRRCRR